MEFKEKKLEELSYAELEEEANYVLSLLSDDSLPLDDAAKIYEYGRKVASIMEKNLSEISNKVTDTIKE